MNILSLPRLAAAVVVLTLLACTGGHSQPAASQSQNGHAHHQGLPAGEAISGESLHQLSASWTNQLGEERHWRDFAGRVMVVAMVYSHCDSACPRVIADMRRIQRGLDEQASQPVFALVSIDPERDTVDHLRKFGAETGLNSLGWQLLRSSEAAVRELAAVLGVQYRRVSAEDFAHSNIISVLDNKGELVHQQQGLGLSPDATIAAIRSLLNPSPTDSDHEHH